MTEEVTFSSDHKEGFQDYDGGNELYKELGEVDEYDSDRPHTSRGDSADEIDPRRLVRDPTLNELRWYYNRTFAKVLIDKPVDDAFKNGYEIPGDNSGEIRDLFVSCDFEENYMFAKKKARRDGFALLFIGWNKPGSSPSTADVPEDITGVSHTKVLRVDDLTDAGKHEIAEDVPLDEENFEVRESGMVINKDITSPDFNDPIGYVLDSDEPEFIYKDWVIHLVNSPETDGNYNSESIDSTVSVHENGLGRWEGESELTPCYDLLKWMKKANWSIGQTLFRYASKMYSVKLPNDATEEEYQNAQQSLTNMNSKSEIILPSADYEVDDYETDGQLEPEEYFDILFNQICACTEMTKSVLFGTQQGTVTGSETDIKNYFNQVERMRFSDIQDDFGTFVKMASNVDTAKGSQVISNVAAGNVEDGELQMDWKPLFKLSEADRVEAVRTSANTMTMLINNYALTPDEARSILSEEWAEFGDLGDLSEDQMDVFDRLNLTQVGAYKGAENAEEEMGGGEAQGNPREQNGGGRVQGENSEPEDPSSGDSGGAS